MSNLFEKAREFANDLLETKEGKKYQEAKYIFESDDEAVAMLQKYSEKTREFQVKKQRNEQGEEFERAKKELNDLILEMKGVTVITEFFKAEEEFNRMVASVMDIFNATLIGESEEKRGCGSGGCGGCSGCH